MPHWLHRSVAACRAVSLSLALAAALPALAYGQTAAGSALKAAFTLNFVKFTTWPALRPGAPLLVCVSSEDSVSDAMAQAFNGVAIDGHPVRMTRIGTDASVRDCQLL